jgi:hypothetical protein
MQLVAKEIHQIFEAEARTKQYLNIQYLSEENSASDI